MAARDVLQAAVVAGGVVEADPAGQMGHRLRPRPIRVVLVPGDHAAVLGRFAEQLVVPEPHAPRAVGWRPGEPPAGSRARRGSPRLDPPGAQGMKQHGRRSVDSFEHVLIPEIRAIVPWPGQAQQALPQVGDLLLVEHAHAGQVAILVEERNLLVGQAETLPRPRQSQVGKRLVTGRSNSERSRDMGVPKTREFRRWEAKR